MLHERRFKLVKKKNKKLIAVFMHLCLKGSFTFVVHQISTLKHWWYFLNSIKQVISTKVISLFDSSWTYLWFRKWNIQYWQKELDILFCSITPTNLGQLSKPGTDLKSAGPDVFKTPPICTIWPSFGWDIWG